MSRRRSTGDLVPRDITEILAREAKAQRGQKKPGSSLGQAFNWLKGSRRKKTTSSGANRTGGSDGKLGLQNQDPSKAGPKGNGDHKRLAVHYTTAQHYQENVFIDGSRPQYLEDLHTEAREGLKILQQEESKNGVNFPDDQSIASTDSLRPEHDISSKDKDCSPESETAIENTDITVTSAVSTRPVLTRQGSTFKPLSPVKRLDKSKKKNRRTTIMGIPNQVQKELALHRSSTFQPLVPTQPSHQERPDAGSQLGVVIIPIWDGVATKEGARVNISELEASSNSQLLQNHLESDFQDEQPYNPKSFRSHHCPTSKLRPKSVAVPGLTMSSSFSSSTMLTFLKEPQGPVMSISPQATYLSTIIPNAVLPASVEVIEIDRSDSRTRGSGVNQGSSVHSASKSSLASGGSSVSPLLSRKSDGDESQAISSQNTSTLMPASASGSNWSKSHSSETIISNPSPVSSKRSARSGTPQRVGQNGDQDLVSLHSNHSGISSPSTKSENVGIEPGSESGVSGSDNVDEEAKNKRNSSRSLSVTKTKQPPAPPRRTNSLHINKFKTDTRVLLDSKHLHDSVFEEGEENTTKKDEVRLAHSVQNPPAFLEVSFELSGLQRLSSGGAVVTADPQPEPSNSPQRTPSEGGKFERTMSPSSGYSSQSGTPTLSPKDISPSSPDKEKMKPVKPERSVSRASSSAASPSSSLTSLSSGPSEHITTDVSTPSPSLPPQGSSLTVSAKELAPHNNTSLTLGAEFRELFNIPPPPKVKAPCPPPPETWVHNTRTFELLCGPCPSVNEFSQKQYQKQDKIETEIQNDANKVISESKVKTRLKGVPVELEGKECSGKEQEQVAGAEDVHKHEETNSTVEKEPRTPERTPKKDPPPVMKKPTMLLQRGEVVSTEHLIHRHQKDTNATNTVKLPVENHTESVQNEIMIVVETDTCEPKPSVSADIPIISKASPPPTPPPAYHPTPPPLRKTPPSSVSMPPEDLQKVHEEIHVAESCWPPPPPPLEGDTVFEGGDEVDFPPPPPLFVAESVPDVDSCITKLGVLQRPTEEVGLPEDVSSDAVTTVCGLIPDVVPGASKATSDSKPEVVLKVSGSDEINDISAAQNILEIVLPAPEEKHKLLQNTGPENLVAVASSCLSRDPVKIEDQSGSELQVSAQLQVPCVVPLAPPIPTENVTHGVTFRRQPSLANRDTKSKELLLRHRSAPIPKEDANIPLVTPSLLQMVRLRSVNMTEDQVNSLSEDNSTNEGSAVQETSPISILGTPKIPQKPIRKSLSLKSPPQTVKISPVTLSSPSMRLQEAIRMKTAAMSSRDGLPSRLGVRSQTYSCVTDAGAPSVKPLEGCDINKSPASTASFIFSKSTKKLVVEAAAASSTDAQPSSKQRLAPELIEVSEKPRVATFSNGGVKCDKVPPPVAKKPTHSQIHPRNGAMQVQDTNGTTPPEATTTRVTADTIETLF